MGEVYQPPHILTRGTVLREALAYAERDIPVFPCKPDGKEPLTRNGFKDATTDPSKIHAWWNAHPLANIGVPTGERSGLLVVDVDHPAGLDALEAEHEELPATRTHRTGSGGMHHLYRYPEGSNIRNSTGKLAHGLDVRGEGGYVIVPPSRTTRAYTVLDDLPLAAPPGWLLEALRRPHSAARKAVSDRGRAQNPHRSSPVGPGEPIPQGQRNWGLYRYGCALRAQGFDQEAILEELEDTNARLCKPPLDAGEIEKIASSAARHEPGNASPQTKPEVLEALEGIEAVNLWGRSWTGQGWKSPRSVMVELIKEARKHGQKTKAGVRVSISIRSLALAAGVSKQTVIKALRKLKDAELIRSINGSGTKSGAYVLGTPGRGVAGFDHSTTDYACPTSGQPLPHPNSPRLRYSKPVYEAVAGVSWRIGTVLRLGKSAENVIDILERAGERMSVAEIGAELGIKNHRDLRRRALPRLEAAGVVECSADGVRLCTDWLAALNRKREEDQEISDYERDKKKYAEQSRNYRNQVKARSLYRVGMSLEEITSELKIGMEDVRRLLDIERLAPVLPEPDGLIGELEIVEDFDLKDEVLAESASGSDHQPAESAKDLAESDHVENFDFEELEEKVLSPLAVVIHDYLEHFPRDVDETPSWIANTIWAYELYPGKPTCYEVTSALEELGVRKSYATRQVA